MSVVHIDDAIKSGGPFVYIGRWNGKYAVTRAASIWANPDKDARRKSPTEARQFFRDYMRNHPGLMEMLPDLRDKTLACWCKRNGTEPCHGDWLLELLAEMDAASQP